MKLTRQSERIVKMVSYQKRFIEGAAMSTLGLIEYENASPQVRAVYDDIMATRKIDHVTNFWKAIAHDPATLKSAWEATKKIMAAGALDPLTKELIYVAVSASHLYEYCLPAHPAGARQNGITS